ncbi:MAG: NB-ARC domain-containing protein [Cyanobacteria bacterium P01_A01_bin.84]
MAYGGISADINNAEHNRLIVGRYFVETGYTHGAIAQLANPEERPALHQSPTPLEVVVRPGNETIESRAVIEETITPRVFAESIAALERGEIVEICGKNGIGKTSLLEYLARHPQVRVLFPDGVVSLHPPHPYVGDILRQIWNFFYKTQENYLPNFQDVYRTLQDKRGLIVLDENQLTEDELELLMNAVPQCNFLLTSIRSRIKNKGYSITLDGLSIDLALRLLEYALKRKLDPEELPAATSLCSLLNGHPTYLQQAAASTIKNGHTLAEIVSHLPSSGAGEELSQQVLSYCTPLQVEILELLALMGNVGLKSKQLISILQVPECLGALENLYQCHLVKFDGTHYIISQNILEVLPPEHKLEASFRTILSYFEDWVEQYQHQLQKMAAEIDALVQIIEVGVRNSCWQDVLYLVKTVDETVVTSKRWGVWKQILQRGMQAAQALQDKFNEAWTHHQLGIIALAFEYNDTACEEFTKALEIRTSLNDEMGISTTRHNLNLLNVDKSAEHNYNSSLPKLYSQLDSQLDTLNTQISRKPQKNTINNIQVNKKSEAQLDKNLDGKSSRQSSQISDTKASTSLPSASLPKEAKTKPKVTIPKKIASSVNDRNSNSEEYLPLIPTSGKKGILSSPMGVMGIGAGILAASGVLAWVTWNSATDEPSAKSTKSPETDTKSNSPKDNITTPKPSPNTQNPVKPNFSTTPENNTPTLTLPDIEPPSDVIPALTPGIEIERPRTNRKYRDYPSLRLPVKKIPNESDSFHPRSKTVTPKIKPIPKETPTPTPTLTPTPTPTPTPTTSTTPTPTPTPTPTISPETTPKSTSTSKPLPQALPTPASPRAWKIFVQPVPETEANPSFTPRAR